MKKQRLTDVPKMNLTPVMDAVFICIFFLLVSLQFIDFQEIMTSKPIFKEEASVDDKKKNKNFKVKILENEILVTEGAREKVLKHFSWDEESMKSFSIYMQSLKEQNPTETNMIVKPKRSIKYSDVVKVVDVVQQPVPMKSSGVNEKLFRSIAFEAME